MSESNGGIYRKIAEVLGSMEDIPKTGTNPHFGYAFHEEQVIVEHLRPRLAEKGVVLVVRQGERHTEETDKGGKVVVAATEVTFVDADDGSSFTARIWGEGQDTQDKGSHKALVGAFKYALMKTFLISAGNDDPEHDRGVSHNGQQSRQPARQQSTAPTCPKCEGELWDNRKKKASGQFNERSPDYACKEKEGCGWAFWIDGATEELKTALERLRLADVITKEGMDNCLSGVIDGDLDSFRIAQDWVNAKEAEAQKQGAGA